MFEIIKNAGPIPKAKGRSRYPFLQMEIGDAFDVPLSGKKHITGSDLNRTRVQSAAASVTKRHGYKFAVRQMPDVIRCWRVA